MLLSLKFFRIFSTISWGAGRAMRARNTDARGQGARASGGARVMRACERGASERGRVLRIFVALNSCARVLRFFGKLVWRARAGCALCF